MIKHHHLLVHMSMSTAEQCVVVKRGGEDWERHLTVLANQNFSLILTFTHFSSQSGDEQWTADLDCVGLTQGFIIVIFFTSEFYTKKWNPPMFKSAGQQLRLYEVNHPDQSERKLACISQSERRRKHCDNRSPMSWTLHWIMGEEQEEGIVGM